MFKKLMKFHIHMVNEKLRKELIDMMKVDQDMRKSDSFDIEVDKKHIERMKMIIAQYGWPKHDLVGEDGARAAWLLVQHSPDPNFQKKCLKLLEQAVKDKQASKEDLAYLTDRVLVHEGKEQLYGTQFYLDKKGKYGPQPIKDRKNLNKRRKELGMEPFEEYEKGLQRRYKESNPS